MSDLSLAQAAYLATMAANNAVQASTKESRDQIAKQRYPGLLKELTKIGGPCEWDARNSSWTPEKSGEIRSKECDIRRRGAEDVLPAVRNKVGPVCARTIGCPPPGWPSGKNMEAMQRELLDALYAEIERPKLQAQLKKKAAAKATAVKKEPGVDPNSSRGAWAMHGGVGFDQPTVTTSAEGGAAADSLGGAAPPPAPAATAEAEPDAEAEAEAEAKAAAEAEAAEAAAAAEAEAAAFVPNTRPKKWVPIGWMTWKICGPWGTNDKYANGIALNPTAPADGGKSRKKQREEQQKGGEGGAEEGVGGADGGTAPAGQEGASASSSTKAGKKPRSGNGADDAPPQGGFNGPPADEGSLNAYLKKCQEADEASMAQFGKLLAVIQHRGDVDDLKERMELAKEEDPKGEEYITLRGQLRELLGKGPPAVPAPTTGQPPAPPAPPQPATAPPAAAQAAAANSST